MMSQFISITFQSGKASAPGMGTMGHDYAMAENVFGVSRTLAIDCVHV